MEELKIGIFVSFPRQFLLSEKETYLLLHRLNKLGWADRILLFPEEHFDEKLDDQSMMSIVEEMDVTDLGTPGGMPNCCDIFDKDNFDRKLHSPWSDDNEIHAEMNALMFAARYPVEVEGCDMYTTLSPCNECLKNISMTGIKNVYYLYLYDRVKINPALLEKVNVQEVPNAKELKKWVEDRGLLYVPKQRL